MFSELMRLPVSKPVPMAIRKTERKKWMGLTGCATTISGEVGKSELDIWSYYDYFKFMKEVSTAEFKSKLSQYLSEVREGNSLYVTSHGHPVAEVKSVASVGGLGIQEAYLIIKDMDYRIGMKFSKHLVRYHLILADCRRIDPPAPEAAA
jgi:prevent-host-death family protein